MTMSDKVTKAYLNKEVYPKYSHPEPIIDRDEDGNIIHGKDGDFEFWQRWENGVLVHYSDNQTSVKF